MSFFSFNQSGGIIISCANVIIDWNCFSVEESGPWASCCFTSACKFCMIFELACKARRLLAIMCIGFLANHRFCKHPQNKLVHKLPMFIYHFSNTFPLHWIHSSMLDISKQFWIIDKANKLGEVRGWIYLFIIRKAHGLVDWYPVDVIFDTGFILSRNSPYTHCHVLF